jgi:hypothetical protein
VVAERAEAHQVWQKSLSGWKNLQLETLQEQKIFNESAISHGMVLT